MSAQRLAAAFFLPDPHGAGSPLPEMLTLAGATDIGTGNPEDPSGLIHCRWAGMTCQAFLDERPTQRLLVMFFPQSLFLRKLSDPSAGSSDPAADLVTAFARACRSLRPDAAVLVTHPHQADVDELWALGGLVLEADAPRLAAERFGLLFVSDHLAEYQQGAWSGTDREESTLEGGRLLFAGKGPRRWW